MATGFMQRFKGKIAAIEIQLASGGLFFESSADSITAGTTQTQAGATVLTNEVNRIATNATVGNGVKLPPSVAGLTIIVVNATTKAMQVYGAGSDTINGAAATSGVSQMANSVVLYCCATAGVWQTEGLGTGFSGSVQTVSFIDALTAAASAAPTFTNSSAVIAMTNTFAAGQPVVFTVTGGTLPTNFSPNTVYYVIPTGLSGTQFEVSATVGGTAISAGSAGSGTPACWTATLASQTIDRFTTVSAAGAACVLPVSVAGLNITVVNAGANILNVYPQNGDSLNAVAGGFFPIPVGGVVEFFTTAPTTWHTLATPAPAAVSYSAATNTSGFTATGAQISGGTAKTILNLTGTLGAGAALTLPTVANLVAAMQAAGLNPSPGQTWELEVQNNSSAAFAWTLTTNTGWTLNGTLETITQTTKRSFLITLTSLTAATSQSLGAFTILAAP